MCFVLPQCECGNTALTIACENEYVKITKLLLEYGAFIDHKNKVYTVLASNCIIHSPMKRYESLISTILVLRKSSK